jgi:hypothetical protein
LEKCEKFLELSPSGRSEKVKNLRLCFKCFGKKHRTPVCKSANCEVCQKPHHTLLHFTSTKINAQSTPEELNSSSFSGIAAGSQVLLSTAIIKIKDKNGNWLTCRALLDNASQSNFCSKKLAEK